MSLIERFRCLAQGTQERLITKSTRNEDLPPKTKHVLELVALFEAPADARFMAIALVEAFARAKLEPFVFGHFLALVLRAAWVDKHHFTFEAFAKRRVLFSSVLADEQTERTHFLATVARYVDMAVRLSVEHNLAMELNTPVSPNTTKDLWNANLAQAALLLDAVRILQDIHWNNIDLFSSPLCEYLFGLVACECSVALFKLLVYLKSFLIDLRGIPADCIDTLQDVVGRTRAFFDFFANIPRLVPLGKLVTFPLIPALPAVFPAVFACLRTQPPARDPDELSAITFNALNEISSYQSRISPPCLEFRRSFDPPKPPPAPTTSAKASKPLSPATNVFYDPDAASPVFSPRTESVFSPRSLFSPHRHRDGRASGVVLSIPAHPRRNKPRQNSTPSAFVPE